MTSHALRSGIYAVVDGETHQASRYPDGTLQITWKQQEIPNDIRITYREDFNLWELRIPPEDCEVAFSVQSYCRHSGRRCILINLVDNKAELYFQGNEWGMSQGDVPDFQVIAPLEAVKETSVSELYDYHEIHQDLKFDSWRKQFGEPSK